MNRVMLAFIFAFAATFGGATAASITRAKMAQQVSVAKKKAAQVAAAKALAAKNAPPAPKVVAPVGPTPEQVHKATLDSIARVTAMEKARVTSRSDSLAKQAVAQATAARRQRLAKMFAVMSAKDAAHVLVQMSDEEIQILLAMIPERPAAAIMSALPPERAAAITKATMHVGSAK